MTNEDYFPVLAEYNLLGLKIRKRAYGYDYYWRDQFFLTSTKYYFVLKVGSVRIAQLVWIMGRPRFRCQINGESFTRFVARHAKSVWGKWKYG